MAWQQISGIPFRQKDEAKLKKEVNRFNRKLKRVQKKYENEDRLMLPEPLKIKDIKTNIKDRRDLNNLYKMINRFMRRGSEEIVQTDSGVKMTKFQRNEFRIGIIRAKANLRKRINDLEEYLENLDEEDKSVEYSKYRITDDEISNLKDNLESLKDVDKRDMQSLENLKKRIDIWGSYTRLYNKNLTYKENYLSALEYAFQYVKGYDELKKKLERVDPMDFYKLISFDEIAADIKYIYDEFKKGKEGDLDGLFERIENSWKKVLKE